MNKLIFKDFWKRGIMGKAALAMVMFVVLAGCTGNTIREEYREQGPVPLVFFCIRDDCSKQLEMLLSDAEKTIHCAFYDVDLRNIISTLGRKSTEVEVKVVLDDEPYSHALSGAGVLVENKPASRMHNKFCIVDGMYVWTGSFNPTFTDNIQNENNGVIMSSVYLAKNYEAEFQELWNGQFSGGSKVEYPSFYHNEMLVENLFCPEDGCEDKVVALITEAEMNVDAMLFSFTSEAIADALLLNTKVRARVLFDASQAGSRYSQFSRLEEFEMDVHKEKSKGKLHHKVFIIDNRTVVTGSYNPTGSGDYRNDENILILHDEKVAKQFAEEFNRLWELNK
jgi:phosphatidylserine/phosphatidylglycerophosphate/cardiolipin synthase-like enzyme